MLRVSVLAVCLAGTVLGQPAGKLGIFEGESDIGNPSKRGSASFDPVRNEYRVTGGGANIWFKADAFHFVWRRFSGDVTLTAEMHFVGSGGTSFRKAGLMVRRGLEPGAPYADAMVHNDVPNLPGRLYGVPALQWREIADEMSRQVRFPVVAPSRIRIERRGTWFRIWLGHDGEPLGPVGAVEVPLGDPVYVGLAVCSHDDGAIETAIFSDVTLESAPPTAEKQN
jgi:TolB protein